jgi:hypothetical protein
MKWIGILCLIFRDIDSGGDLLKPKPTKQQLDLPHNFVGNLKTELFLCIEECRKPWRRTINVVVLLIIYEQ